jgi:hypothetical protein
LRPFDFWGLCRPLFHESTPVTGGQPIAVESSGIAARWLSGKLGLLRLGAPSDPDDVDECLVETSCAAAMYISNVLMSKRPNCGRAREDMQLDAVRDEGLASHAFAQIQNVA